MASQKPKPSLFDKTPNAKIADKAAPLPGRKPSKAFLLALEAVEKLGRRGKK